MKNQVKVSKLPRISQREIIKELSHRTGLSTGLVEKVLKAHEEIIQQCLCNQIQVPFGKIGVFSFKVVPPRKYIEWNGYLNKTAVIFYQNKADGYIKPLWKYLDSFNRKARRASAIPYGSMPNIDEDKPYTAFVKPFDKEGNPKEKIDYIEYMKEKHPEYFEEKEQIEKISHATAENYYDEYEVYVEDDDEEEEDNHSEWDVDEEEIDVR